ncbi:MAG TPA: glycosyltransferase [Spirochaetota bacterium]|nr:glycosyltransferase [Spirochaetota bacterium]HOM09930.1 glycosyltransferase [Spirochaetota bacterium]HPP48631.1 glycosyltransferase [Spirochaetota bacterium]HXK66418.1 glycosyltransferase [Spirochaetota bacterium]
MSDILVAIIVRNNEELLRRTLDSICNCPYAHVMPLIIDDGSFDQSPSIVSDVDVHFVMHEEPLGYGGALMSAFAYAKDYSLSSLFMLPLEAFADWHTVSGYLSFFQDADIITGNRFTGQTFNEKKQYNDIVQYFNQHAGLNIVDPFSPLKGISMNHADLFEITEFSDAALVQILIQAAHFKLRIKEFECMYPEKNLLSHLDDIENLPGLKDFITGELHLYPYTKGH